MTLPDRILIGFVLSAGALLQADFLPSTSAFAYHCFNQGDVASQCSGSFDQPKTTYQNASSGASFAFADLSSATLGASAEFLSNPLEVVSGGIAGAAVLYDEILFHGPDNFGHKAKFLFSVVGTLTEDPYVPVGEDGSVGNATGIFSVTLNGIEYSCLYLTNDLACNQSGSGELLSQFQIAPGLYLIPEIVSNNTPITLEESLQAGVTPPNGIASFGHTATTSIEVSDGVTWTSASGVFGTVPAAEVPEPYGTGLFSGVVALLLLARKRATHSA